MVPLRGNWDAFTCPAVPNEVLTQPNPAVV